jgi:hypothetical protein
MKKIIVKMPESVKFDNTHKGAKWTFDGVHYCNEGNVAEAVLNYYFNNKLEYDHNSVRFNIEADLPAQGISVKSGRFSLASAGLLHGEDFYSQLQDYTMRDAASEVAYGILMNDSFVYYLMNHEDFYDFMVEFYDRKEFEKYNRIRGSRNYGKIVEWLEKRV